MKLHENQIKILELLMENKGESPLSLRDIMYEIPDLKSPSHVQHHIKQLEKKGYLKINPNNPQDFQILMEPEKPISYLNLYGLAKCGTDGTLLSGNPIERIPIYSKLIRFSIKDAFLVEASGDSMEPKIHEGDLVIAKKNESPNNGDIVICSYKGKAHIKKLTLLKNHKLLESLNKKHKPIVIENDSYHTEGVMKGIICSHKETINQ